MITRYVVWPAVARAFTPHTTEAEQEFVLAALRMFRDRGAPTGAGVDTAYKIQVGMDRDIDLVARNPEEYAGDFLVDQPTGGWCASWIEVHPQGASEKPARTH